MRRIVMFNRVTADGYFAGADGNLSWTVPEDEVDNAGVKGMSETDTILFGRRTYQMFEGFWPQALQHAPTAPDPHAEGRQTEGIRAMAEWIDAATKVVFSSTLKEVTWKNARLLGAFTPEKVRALKEEPGKDIMIFGSGSIASLLTQHGLVDEYQFIVTPALLGSGQQLIRGVTESTRLTLLEAKAHPAGNVTLRYARATQG